MKTNNSIDILRLLSIFLIIMNHLVFNLTDGSNTTQVFFLNNKFIASPLLAFISGNLFCISLQRSTLFEIIKKKSKSLLIPYTAWTFIYFLIYVVSAYLHRKYGLGVEIYSLRSFSNDSLISIRTYFYYFFLPPIPANFWFFQNLIFVIPLTVLLHKVSDRNWFWVSILFTISCCYIFNINIWFSERFLPFWILGYISLTIKKPVKPLSQKLNLLIICGLVAILYLPQYKHALALGAKYIPITLVVWTLIMTLWTFLDGFRFGTRVINFTRNYSFFFHASHLLIFVFLNKIISLLPLSSLSSPISINLLLGFEFLICLLLLIFFAKVLSRYFPKMYIILCGNRPLNKI